MNKINLQDIVGGQLQAKFERSFEKVIENLQERFFDCAGKPTDRPCILFKERKQERKNGFQRILEERGEKDGEAE